ncbi:MAG: hypothetical protein JXB62_00505 [Pirellulales bacterium]|nr:hypothetical protein [Pirellulales bacterium]
MDRPRAMLPSWLISMLLHLLLMLLLGLTLRLAPPQGAAAERTAEVGIVLKHQDGPQEYFESEDDAGGEDSQTATTAPRSVAELLDESVPADPSNALPAAFAVIGPGGLEPGGVGSAIGADTGPRATGRSLGGKARTGVFGIEGEGYKFVYVFDRSGSMGGSARSPLGVAKAQLIASLKSLEKTHQFQIIFYNERSWRFNPTGHPNKLFFATEQNKALAAKFIGSIVADGSTDHEAALVAAIKLQPDVIFFLTDADQPVLGPRALEKIQRMASGITIHAIEFGFGPQTQMDNFLVQLARQNGGKHGYVDVSRFAPAPRQ